jgi:GAF domain-containing protein
MFHSLRGFTNRNHPIGLVCGLDADCAAGPQYSGRDLPGGAEHGIRAAGTDAPAVMTLTRALADRIASVAQLLNTEEKPDEALRRLTDLGVELVPGCAAAAVTIAAGSQALTFAASDARIDKLHRLQFDRGAGPVVESLRHNEPRRIDDTAAEPRWPAFCRAAAKVGIASCLVLPLRTDRRPAGAVALYGQERHAFEGAAHDIALTFAAQGGTAMHNAAQYRECRQMLNNLHIALASQATIEQAKGILHAEYGVPPEEAFQLLSRVSQNTNRKVREISADLVEGRIDRETFRPVGGE